MRPELARALLAAVLLCCTLLAQAQPLKTWGYVAAWMPDGWRDLPLQQFERLVFFEMAFDAHGEITERNGWPEAWSALRDAAGPTPIDVTVRCFDAAIVSSVFDKPAATRYLLEQIEAVAADAHVAGIQLDFEIYDTLKPATLASYRQFLNTLAQHLHQQRPAKQLTLFYGLGMPAALYDARSLAQADFVVVQGYDAHWRDGTESGPLSPLMGDEAGSWQRSVQQVLDAGLRRDQVVMGFPLYGYEWRVASAQTRERTVGEGRVLYYAVPSDDSAGVTLKDRMQHHGYVYDPLSTSTYYTFKQDAQWYTGWFENGYSLRKKREFIAAQGLRGLAFFALGYDKGELVREHLRAVR